jgi:F420-0:gamma-glutamyl ligase
LRKKYQVKNIGVIIVDSHTVPLRRGVMGIGLGYYGFIPIRDYRGTRDLFGRKFKMSTVDLVDSLATAAMLEMGEGAERTPLALIEEVPFVQFTAKPYHPEKKRSSLEIHWKEDLYGPLLRAVKWRNK